MRLCDVYQCHAPVQQRMTEQNSSLVTQKKIHHSDTSQRPVQSLNDIPRSRCVQFGLCNYLDHLHTSVQCAVLLRGCSGLAVR